MKQLINSTRKFLRDEEGVTMVEYGLIAALIAVACLLVIFNIGSQLNVLFTKIKACLVSATATTCT